VFIAISSEDYLKLYINYVRVIVEPVRFSFGPDKFKDGFCVYEDMPAILLISRSKRTLFQTKDGGKKLKAHFKPSTLSP
jgi:hypothetical protein